MMCWSRDVASGSAMKIAVHYRFGLSNFVNLCLSEDGASDTLFPALISCK